MNNQREAEKYIVKDQQNSTQTDMYQFELIRM